MTPHNISATLESCLKDYDSNFARAALLREIMFEFGSKKERKKWSELHTLSTFRRQLKALRAKLGASQAAMADTLGMSQSRYTRIESGKADISLTTARRLALLFDCHVEVRMVNFSDAVKADHDPVEIPARYHHVRSGCELELYTVEESLRIVQKHRMEQEKKVDKLGMTEINRIELGKVVMKGGPK